MSEVPTPDTASRAAFVRLLRERAEGAAEASVHHASLSQRYLQLSQKFADLAEQAGSATVAELQHQLQTLDDQASLKSPERTFTGSGDNWPRQVAAESELPPPHFPQRSVSEDGFRDSSPSAAAVLSARPAVPAVAPESAGTDVASGSVANGTDSSEVGGNSSSAKDRRSSPPRTETRRKRRAKTRTLVERFRSVRLAGIGRVRVRARASDLKPKQRTATEELKKGSGSIVTSGALFALVLVLLSLVTWQLEIEQPLDPIICAFAAEVKPVEEPQPVEPAEEEQGEQTEQETEEPVEELEEPEPEPAEDMPEEAAEQQDSPLEEQADMSESEPLPPTMEAAEAAAEAGEIDPATVNNRSSAGRQALLKKYGGSAASESAVQRGLQWLVSVQHPQGWWDFVHVGPSGNPGSVNNPIGGTAYALLPFLAAGQTHQEGSYQQQVGAGLTYLASVGITVPAGYDLRGLINKRSDDREPNEAYYVHGAATLVLCEAYAMTRDRRLKKPAEGAVRFLINSQDQRGGGWRYNPQQPGSTSVTAIQVMALAAARKADVRVPDATWQGIMHYLDSVQVDGEGRYGYEIEKKQYSGACTAMALLCRMYLGWGRDDGDLRAGVALLDKAGPYDNLYSLYFATQVMKNWGGEEWQRWNARLRDDLVAAQETEGPAAGSWKPRTRAIHAKQGGRLLTTALATLTLEVYYRYKPLLPEEVSDEAAE
ncbi:MAG: terpene cyclase/mutase family protein [Fuerstiella sp.]